MAHAIKKVAVIGAGVMGSGIAAQVANAGLDVVLLDIRDGAAQAAIDRMKAANPATSPFDAGFMDPANARRVTPGTMERDIEKIADADLIIEAVFERLDVKESTFRLIEKHAKPDAIITSNTSTITIDRLVEKMPPEFRARFLNTHFFNPPRFMRLLEIISGPETAPEAIATLSDFGDRVLGKKVIHAKDAPGFIANRIGVYLMEHARATATDLQFPIESVDGILSRPFGFPDLGVFKLADAVGLDILSHVGRNLHSSLPESDAFNAVYRPAQIDAMAAEGYVGKKGKGGFYRVNPETKGREVLDLNTGLYRAVEKSSLGKTDIAKGGGYAKFFESGTPAANFAWPVLRDTLCYVLNHADEMAHDIESIDQAMCVGYNWKDGPFQLLDRIGVKWFAEKLAAEKIPVPALLTAAAGRSFYRVQDNRPQVMDFTGAYHAIVREEGVLKLSDIKLGQKPLLSHASASVWDIGDGVVCVEFTSPQNALDPSILHVLNESIKLVEGSEGKYKAMVIYNEGKNFSVGANLKLIDIFAKAAGPRPFTGLAPPNAAPVLRKAAAALDGVYGKMGGKHIAAALNGKVDRFVSDLIFQGQSVYKALREANFPVIGAPRGRALGGGCEILLHCDGIQAGAESYLGLVEVGVGLIPAWGGCARYLERAQDAKLPFRGPMVPFKTAAAAISAPMESLSTSGQDAKRKLWLRPGDGVSMNDDRILADAKARALSMVPGYAPPKPAVYSLPGLVGKTAIRMNADALYFKGGDPNRGVNHVDLAIVDRLAHVLCGGETIARRDVEHHVAANQDGIRALIDLRGEAIGVNPSVPLTEARILQLEREAFMALFRGRASQNRISCMMERGRPLREQRPSPEPAPHDIRAGLVPQIDLPRRNPDGKPLSGPEGKRLAEMANATARVYRVSRMLGMI